MKNAFSIRFKFLHFVEIHECYQLNNWIYLFGNVRIKVPITKGITIQGITIQDAAVLCGIVLWR